MRALITGANGTVGKELRRFLEFQGAEVYIWDREKVPIFEYHIMEEFIQKINPDVIYHLAIASTLTGVGNETWRANYEWPSELAWICRIHQIKFVFTSTYEIFSDYNIGPFSLDTKPDAFEGFGFEKRMAEERVVYQNPQSIVIRLPWQISNESNKKGMISYLDKEMEEYDRIVASENYYPCCSFLDDTVKEIYRISTEFQSGKFMIDANDGLNFYEIVNTLNTIYNKGWKIVKNNDYRYNQRMVDSNCKLESLSRTLKEKMEEIQIKSKKKIGINGAKYMGSLIDSYEKLGYKIDTIVVKNPENYKNFCKTHSIENCTSDIEALGLCDQIIIVDPENITYDFLMRHKTKHIVFSSLPHIANREEYEKFLELFENSNFYTLLEFNQLITIRKIKEQIQNDSIGPINSIFIDIGVKNQNETQKNFQEIIINPMSFINNYFNAFKLDYSDYNENMKSVLTHHMSGDQRMTINFFKLWYDGIKLIMRMVGDEGEIRVEGRYTEESGWSFKPVKQNDVKYGQGESSSTAHEILDLALQEYLKKLEKVMHEGETYYDIYKADRALKLYEPFVDIWKKK